MRVNDPSITHLQRLGQLLGEWAGQGIEMLEHQHHPAAFGSFLLVLAKGHRHVKFEWDGKESVLAVYCATVQNRGRAPVWTHDADVSLPRGAGLYEEIGSQSVGLLIR